MGKDYGLGFPIDQYGYKGLDISESNGFHMDRPVEADAMAFADITIF